MELQPKTHAWTDHSSSCALAWLISDGAGDWPVLEEAVAQQCCHPTLLKQCDDQGTLRMSLYQLQLLGQLLCFLLTAGEEDPISC